MNGLNFTNLHVFAPFRLAKQFQRNESSLMWRYHIEPLAISCDEISMCRVCFYSTDACVTQEIILRHYNHMNICLVDSRVKPLWSKNLVVSFLQYPSSLFLKTWCLLPWLQPQAGYSIILWNMKYKAFHVKHFVGCSYTVFLFALCSSRE